MARQPLTRVSDVMTRGALTVTPTMRVHDAWHLLSEHHIGQAPVLNAQGHVENVKVIRSLDPYCDKEAIRVVKSLPQWIPGKQNGRNVPVYYTCPIVFKLQ